jgi:L,D-transpeptidase YcbB
VFRPGDGDPRAAVLSRRLAVSGDLAAHTGNTAGRVSAAEVIAALQRFQARHGLRPSGLVDDTTLEALNVTAESRLAQLRINMARLRDLSELAVRSPRYVLVNIPAFQLEAVEGNQVSQRHRVIVGRVERPTPSVSATIRNVNFFPHWNVPDSVAQLDLIPHVQKEPDYLDREHIRVLSGGVEVASNQVNWQTASAAQIKFRQDPGPWNALGLIRFDMPNEHTVYLHDTPMKNLFGQRHRAMSAGCVRVESVPELAEWIMRDVSGWDGAKIRNVLDAGQPVDAALTTPVSVHFVYVTAWGSSDGRVEFRSDLNGRDGISELVANYSNPAIGEGASRGPTMSP